MAEKLPKQYLFVSNRDITVTSLIGRSIFFAKGVPTHCPREMHAEVMEKGVIPVEEADAVMVTERAAAQPKPAEPEDAMERSDAIAAAIQVLVARNNTKDFSAGGVPTSAAVSAVLGWRADAAAIRPEWDKFKRALAVAEQA